MSKLPIIFVHGWGCTPKFWDAVITHLPGEQAYIIDLGFAGDEKIEAVQEGVYVTHSLGTLWALKHASQKMKALISINGFKRFQNFVDPKATLSMKRNLRDDPEKQMRVFWDLYDLPYLDSINSKKLSEGLDWLMGWDVTEELDQLQRPVLSMMGGQDPLLKIDLMQKEWQNTDTRICKQGKHALPLSHPDWCARHIKEFLNELET